MAQDRRKDDLKKLLAFLGNIIHEPENSWFVDELCSMLPLRSGEGNSLAKIEKYLGLDYNIDKFVPLINFSFVKDEYTRECFNADYREMLRYRLGSRDHKINFLEYCRYASIIGERVLNIYFSRLSELEEIKREIKQHNTKAYLENVKSLSAIAYSVKLWSFCNKFSLFSVKESLDYAREIRNLQSHGDISPDDEDVWFRNRMLYYKQQGLPILHNGQIDTYTLRVQNPTTFNIYNNVIKKTQEHRKYMQIAWKKGQPFEEVNTRLKELVDHVATLLACFPL
ncbi:MAG: hypothetical protein K2M79_04195 [Muribaculaceae bacterium]|nr:hypothetical protein [Muribaculaceae bacterium]